MCIRRITKDLSIRPSRPQAEDENFVGVGDQRHCLLAGGGVELGQGLVQLTQHGAGELVERHVGLLRAVRQACSAAWAMASTTLSTVIPHSRCASAAGAE
jgi:hypothetical protein